MKKRIISGFISMFIVAGACAYAAEYTKFSSRFVKNFKDCDTYQETTNSTFEGQNFTTTRKINGWMNGFCRYQETVSSATDKYQISCNFTDMQVEDLYEAMKSRSKKIERQNMDLFTEVTDKSGQSKFVKSGSTVIKGNKAYLLWTKYQNNPYFCSVKKL